MTRLPGEVIPRVRSAARSSVVHGSLDKGIIRRVVRRHLNEIKDVYQRQLKRNPNIFNGRHNIKFTIGPTGHVLRASVSGPAASAPQFAQGLARVVRRWRFPVPRGGGTVIVSYPLMFRTAGVDTQPRSGTKPVPGATQEEASKSTGSKTTPRATKEVPLPLPPRAAPTRTTVRAGLAETPRTGTTRPPRKPGTAPLPPLPRGRRWVRMKKVWFQQATLRRISGPAARDLRLVALRRRELARAPLSRDRHQRLYAALARAGRGAEALQVVEAWLARDPRSREALELLAEAAARQGQRRRALQALGSLLDQAPSDVTLHRRLLAMYHAAGNTRLACAHRLSLGSLAILDAVAQDEARDCREGFSPRPEPARVNGRVTLRARWQGGADLDLALVTSRGRRISWLANRSRLRFANVASSRREELAARWLPVGRYRVEVVAGLGSRTLPASGVLHIRAPGLKRRLSFSLTGGRTYVAELRIASRSRLVPAP